MVSKGFTLEQNYICRKNMNKEIQKTSKNIKKEMRIGEIYEVER